MGSADNLLFTASSDITIDTIFSLNNLGAGSHNLYFRAKDSNGRWSLPQHYHFSLLDLKVFLEGPFNHLTGSMNNQLYSDGLIPLDQPFNSNPEADWYYDGSETVSTIPNSDVVDWVLIQYRDATSPDQATDDRILDTKPAFLLSDGRIRELDGSSLLLMNEVVTENLYTAIFHRNHLGILAAESMPLSGTYDFSESSLKVFGGEIGYKLLDSEIWGLFSGDANGNGIIDLDDKNLIWSQQSGLSGYKFGDLNLDTQIENRDKNDFWKINLGKESQIPE